MLTEREGQEKKVFTTPKLHVYGDIREITLTFGMDGSSDGGGMGNNKTAKL